MRLSHLERLEAESIYIMRDAVAQAEEPVMLYSIGKDSSVMLHLARKAFHPAKPPFPLLHIDTAWRFREAYALCERVAREEGLELLVHTDEQGLAHGIDPFSEGSPARRDAIKTESLERAIEAHGVDLALDGSRREEERSRAQQGAFSFRSGRPGLTPTNQRPELWGLYNARKRRGESVWVFPLSDWSELDVWLYIHAERIPVAPLYFARERPVVERDGMTIVVDDARLALAFGGRPVWRKVRFRTLGRFPLTGAIASEADTLEAVIEELSAGRHGRVIDRDHAASTPGDRI